MRRALLVLGAAVLAVPLAAVAGVWAWIQLDAPTPPDELLEDEPTIDLAAYAGSDPASGRASGDAPEVLILGSVHLHQDDYGFSRDELAAVVDALAGFEPDLVAVEHLPPDWPVGAGRDYRPDLDLERLADRWGLSRAAADALVAAAQEEPTSVGDPCELGRAHLLRRDLANALYHWSVHDCDDPQADPELAAWWERVAQHELVQIGAPVAAASGVPELTSFDDQSEDAAWFLHEEALTPEALTSPGELWHLLPVVNPRTRELQAHADAHDERLADLLHHLNSPDWIAAQYWAYEQSMPDIEVRDAGARQRENYWLRNERMFERLHAAVEDADAQRVLVIVGAGHKYFLDELARDHGYRWVDPREWLPPRDARG